MTGVQTCALPISVNYDSATTTISQSCGDSVYHYSYVVNAVTYTWKYTTHVVPEDFAVPADSVKTVSCPALVERPDTVLGKMPVVTDACGNTLTPVFVGGEDIPVCEGNVVYTYRYTDCQGHEHLWHFRYTIEVEEFTITEPSGSSMVACLSAATMPTAPAVDDNCGNALTPSDTTIVDSPNPLTCEGTRTYTFTYTDCEGNQKDWIMGRIR